MTSNRELHELDRAMVQSKWRKRMCLQRDSITYGTGRVVLLSHQRQTPGAHPAQVLVSPAGQTWLIDYMETHDYEWECVLAELCVGFSDDGKLRCCGGECAWGDSGFVAVTDRTSDELVWLAYFENSNPFAEVALRGSQLLAVSTDDDLYTFSMHAPEKIAVEPGSKTGWNSQSRRLG